MHSSLHIPNKLHTKYKKKKKNLNKLHPKIKEFPYE